MIQNASFVFESQRSVGDPGAESQHKSSQEIDAREQMVAARREQQRLQLLRKMYGRR